jgi:copper chaperone CopZ
MLISMNLEDLAGVRSVDCDHATGRTSVGFDEEIINAARIREAIVESGYDAECVE